MAITAEYKQYLEKSDQWQVLRHKILKRASYKCEICEKAKPLQVHHLTYDRIFHEQLDDLQAVCDRCHRRLHGLRPWWVRALGGLWKWAVR